MADQPTISVVIVKNSASQPEYSSPALTGDLTNGCEQGLSVVRQRTGVTLRFLGIFIGFDVTFLLR